MKTKINPKQAAAWVAHQGKPGMENHQSILWEDDVECIRRDAARGLPDSEIAFFHQVARGTVWDVKTRRTWKHV